MKPQNQPMILPRQIIAGFLEFTIILILYLFSADEHTIKIVLIMFWITIAEMMAPTILKKIGVYGLKKTFLFYLPFYVFILPLAFYHNRQQFDLSSIVFGTAAVCILLLLNRKEIAQIINSLESKRPIAKDKFVVKFIMCLVPIISEEILFRGFWITSNSAYSESFAVLTSALLFVYAHFINRWANVMYRIKNYIMQFILGLILAIVFVQTRSLITCCYLHFLYNISDFILLIKRYRAKEQTSLFNDYG